MIFFCHVGACSKLLCEYGMGHNIDIKSIFVPFNVIQQGNLETNTLVEYTAVFSCSVSSAHI